MEIFNEIVQFFSLGRLFDCETFPEFLGCFCEILFAIVIVVFIFRAVFYTCFRIYEIK